MALQNYLVKNVKAYLEGVFHIPNYQRDFSWESDQLEDFWTDLQNLIKLNKKGKFEEHFFGQILVHNSQNSQKFIIDGQQRTITSIIFLRAINFLFERIAESEMDSDIGNDAKYKSSQILIDFIGKSKKGEFHITLGETDKEYFRKNIQTSYPKNKKETKKSHERIRSAYFYFLEKISEEIKDKKIEEKFDSLDFIYKTFIEQFIVLYVEATDLGEAFVIFETLNARGKELETSDLLKNHLFSSNVSQITKSEETWNEMIRNLGQSDATKFIRHFWNSNREFTREKALYRVISHSINTPRLSFAFLKDLNKNAKFYNSICFPFESNFIENEQIKTSLNNLKILKASSFYPIALALFQNEYFSHIEIAEIIEKIEILIFRNFSILGGNPNKLEKIFSELAVRIFDNEFTSHKQIISIISKEIVDDDEFLFSLSNWSGSNSSKELLRYFFRKLHNSLDTMHEININNDDVHIEHIMPENLGSGWASITPESHDKNIWKLGNLALLSGKLNKEISNKAFSEKKKAYLDSQILPNKEIAKFEKWTEEEIRLRQNQLTQLASKIWIK